MVIQLWPICSKPRPIFCRAHWIRLPVCVCVCDVTDVAPWFTFIVKYSHTEQYFQFLAIWVAARHSDDEPAQKQNPDEPFGPEPQKYW